MWVERPVIESPLSGVLSLAKPILSCSDCGPQLGYKILAPLEPVTSD